MGQNPSSRVPKKKWKIKQKIYQLEKIKTNDKTESQLKIDLNNIETLMHRIYRTPLLHGPGSHNEEQIRRNFHTCKREVRVCALRTYQCSCNIPTNAFLSPVASDGSIVDDGDSVGGLRPGGDGTEDPENVPAVVALTDEDSAAMNSVIISNSNGERGRSYAAISRRGPVRIGMHENPGEPGGVRSLPRMKLKIRGRRKGKETELPAVSRERPMVSP